MTSPCSKTFDFVVQAMDLLDGAKSCSWGNFVMALQACLSLFWRSRGRGGKKVYPVRAQPAMHARLAFPSPLPKHLHHKRRGIIPPLSAAVASYSPEGNTG